VTSPRQVDAPAAAPTGEEVFDESLLVEPDMAALEEQPSQEKHGAIQRLSQRGEKERSASPAQPVEATFYKELSYVRRAQAALRDGQSALALGLMQELDGLPTKGALGAERNVTKVLALCQLGRELEAANIAAKVVQADTGRVYQQRLKGSCAGKHLPEP
jgi:hypothetical protein